MTLFDFNFTQSAVPASRIIFIFVIFHQLRNRNPLTFLKFQWSFNLTVTANEVKVMDGRRMTFLLYFSAISFVMVWCLIGSYFQMVRNFLIKSLCNNDTILIIAMIPVTTSVGNILQFYRCQHVCVPAQKKDD